MESEGTEQRSESEITSAETSLPKKNDKQTTRDRQDTEARLQDSGTGECGGDESGGETGNHVDETCVESDKSIVQPREEPQYATQGQHSEMEWQFDYRHEGRSDEKESCDTPCGNGRIKKIEMMLNRENTDTLKENHEIIHKRKKLTPDRRGQTRKTLRKCSSPNHVVHHRKMTTAPWFSNTAECLDKDLTLETPNTDEEETSIDCCPERESNKDEDLLKFAEILYKCSLCTTLPCILTSRSAFLSHVRENHLETRFPGITCQNCRLHFHTHTDLLVHISDSQCRLGQDSDLDSLCRQSPQEQFALDSYCCQSLLQSEQNIPDAPRGQSPHVNTVVLPADEYPSLGSDDSLREIYNEKDEDELFAGDLKRRSSHHQTISKVGTSDADGDAARCIKRGGERVGGRIPGIPGRSNFKRRNDGQETDSQEECKSSTKRRSALPDSGQHPPTAALLTTVEYHSSRHLNQLQLFTEQAVPSPTPPTPLFVNHQQRDHSRSGPLVSGLPEGINGFPSFTPEFGRFTKLIREGGKIVYFCQVCNVKCQVKAAFQVHCNGVRHHNHVNMASKNKLKVASPDSSYMTRDSSGRAPLREVAVVGPPQVTSLKEEVSFMEKITQFFQGQPDVSSVLSRGKSFGAVTASPTLTETAAFKEPATTDPKDPVTDAKLQDKGYRNDKKNRSVSFSTSPPLNLQQAVDPTKHPIGSVDVKEGGLILQEVTWDNNVSRKSCDKPAIDTCAYDLISVRRKREASLSEKVHTDHVNDRDLYDLVRGMDPLGAFHVATSAEPMPDNSASIVASRRQTRSSSGTSRRSDFTELLEEDERATKMQKVQNKGCLEVVCIHEPPRVARAETENNQKRLENRQDAQKTQQTDTSHSIHEAEPKENRGDKPATTDESLESQYSGTLSSLRRRGIRDAGSDTLVSADKYRFSTDHTTSGFHPSMLSKTWFHEAGAAAVKEEQMTWDGLGGTIHDEDAGLEANKGPNNEGWKVTKIRDVLRGVLTASGKGSSVLRDVLLQRVSLELREPLVLYWGPACNRAVRELFPHCLAQRKGKFKKTYFFGLCLLPGTEETRFEDPVDCLNYRPLRDMTQDLEQLLEHLPGLLFWSGEVSHGVTRDEVLHVLAARLSENEVYHWGMQCNKALRILFPLVLMKRKGKYKTVYFGVDFTPTAKRLIPAREQVSFHEQSAVAY